MPDDKSRYFTFIENFDQGNKFLESPVKRKLDQMKDSITSSTYIDSNGLMAQISKTLSNANIKPYDKAIAIGDVLAIGTSLILGSSDSGFRGLGITLLNFYLSMAKETEDSQLLKFASEISDVIDKKSVLQIVPQPILINNQVTRISVPQGCNGLEFRYLTCMDERIKPIPSCQVTVSLNNQFINEIIYLKSISVPNQNIFFVNGIIEQRQPVFAAAGSILELKLHNINLDIPAVELAKIVFRIEAFLPVTPI